MVPRHACRFMAGTNEAKLVVYPIDNELRAKGQSLVNARHSNLPPTPSDGSQHRGDMPLQVNWIAETYVEKIEAVDWNREGKRQDFAHLFASWGFATAEQRAAAAAAGPEAELRLEPLPPTRGVTALCVVHVVAGGAAASVRRLGRRPHV